MYIYIYIYTFSCLVMNVVGSLVHPQEPRRGLEEPRVLEHGQHLHRCTFKSCMCFNRRLDKTKKIWIPTKTTVMTKKGSSTDSTCLPLTFDLNQ